MAAEPAVASTVEMLVATSRQADPAPGVLFNGERGRGLSLADITVSIPNQRAVGTVNWPRTVPGDPARDFVATYPEATQAVVSAVLAGWTKAFHDLETALSLSTRLRPDMSRLEQEGQLADIRALALTGATLTDGLGYPDPRHMEQALKAIAEVEGHAPGPVKGLVDPRFWEKAPEAVRSRSW